MPDQFKIYTKTGDKGETSLIGGKRVPKFHPRIEAYGTVDELNSFIGLLRDQPEVAPSYKEILFHIQDRLFTLESVLALDPETPVDMELPEIAESDIKLLESEIDAMNEVLPELKSFILPGGHVVVSYCHVARTVCRRAERQVIRLAQSQEVESITVRYLNRLSDYLFVLGRKLALDLGVDENIWKPVI
jgi:cob(I)alamin adenosyltransferase